MDLQQRTVLVSNQLPFGSIDSPPPGATLPKQVTITGWALAGAPLTRLEIFVDGVKVGEPTRGLFRPDVAAAFPPYPDNPNSGYTFTWDTSSASPGQHTLLLRATSAAGTTDIGTRTVTVTRTPFASIDAPAPNSPVAGLVRIEGWALDDGGVTGIAILLDGAVIGQATRGLSRPDVAAAFPGFPDNPNSGYSYTWDTRTLLNGNHTLALRVTDAGGSVDLQSRTVIVSNQLPFGSIDSPPPGATLPQQVPITGWALAGAPLTKLELFLDSQKIGEPTRGLFRPDVAAAFPPYPDNPNSGYTFTWDTSCATPGPHTLFLRATSASGSTDIGTRMVTVTGPQVVETVTRVISAATGGTITLPSGSSVSIPPGVLTTDQRVTLSLLSSMPKQPPTGIITSVGPALLLCFATSGAATAKFGHSPGMANRQAASSSGDIQFVLKLGTGTIAGIAGSAPMANIVDLTGGDHFVGIPGSLANNTASFSVRLSTVPNTQSVVVSSANIKPIDIAPLPAAGAKIWKPSQGGTPGSWVDGTPGFNPGLKTLVLVHGMNSSVERAFTKDGKPCVDEIMATLGYQQVVGFDYNWSQGIEKSGQELADFLSKLKDSMKAAGITDPQIDIMAHSEGTVVALSAASKTDSRGDPNIRVGNMILLGGPIMGTPVAALGVDAQLAIIPLMTAMLNIPYIADSLVRSIIPEQGDLTLQQIFQGQFAQDLLPGSAVLAAIRQRVQAATNLSNTRYIVAPGTQPIPGLAILKPLCGEDMDGLICLSSAQGKGSGLNVEEVGPYPLDHTHLACDEKVIQDLANKVNPPPAVIEVSPSSLEFTTVQGTDPSPQQFTLSNTEGSPLKYLISDTATWLSESASSGTLNPGQSVAIGVSVTAVGLAAGTYTSTITISDPAASNSPQTVSVKLTVNPTADLTWNVSVTLCSAGTDECVDFKDNLVPLPRSGGKASFSPIPGYVFTVDTTTPSVFKISFSVSVEDDIETCTGSGSGDSAIIESATGFSAGPSPWKKGEVSCTKRETGEIHTDKVTGSFSASAPK